MSQVLRKMLRTTSADSWNLNTGGNPTASLPDLRRQGSRVCGTRAEHTGQRTKEDCEESGETGT